jgi:hypothetical protein
MSPEQLLEPKRVMLTLLSKSTSREIRESMVRKRANGVIDPGAEYNARLGAFASDNWRPSVAAKFSPSLAKAIRRIADLKTIKP